MTKQDFIEMIENLPDDAELVVSNYTIGFVVTDVEYNELWNWTKYVQCPRKNWGHFYQT